MTVVDLYSGDGCHLCEEALDVLSRVRARHPFVLNVVTIREGDGEYERFRESIPVVMINREVVFRHRVPERALVEKLKQAEKQ